MLINPRPLLEFYFLIFPDRKKDKAAQAFSYASNMTIGWMWSNCSCRCHKGGIVWFFLYFMISPEYGSGRQLLFCRADPQNRLLYYGSSTHIDRLAISPLTALWVPIFYIGLDEIIGDFIIPRIRSKQ
jgi:hypothetical protein